MDPVVRHNEFKLAQYWANHYVELAVEEKLSLYGVERQAQVGELVTSARKACLCRALKCVGLPG